MSEGKTAESEKRINNVRLGEEKGLLSPIGDPLGTGLEKSLKPIGNTVGGLTQGITGQSTDLLRGAGEALGGTDNKGQTPNKGDAEQYGGKAQTAENPLGL